VVPGVLGRGAPGAGERDRRTIPLEAYSFRKVPSAKGGVRSPEDIRNGKRRAFGGVIMAGDLQSQKSSNPEASAQSKRDARRQTKADLAAAKARAKAERPFYKKPWVWVIGVIAFIVVVSLASGGTDTDTGTAGGGTQQAAGGGGESQPKAGGAKVAGIGDPAADGQFTFTVNDFECGLKKVGPGFLAERAQGQFCVARMSVKNTGDQAQTLDASSQFAYIAGKEYEAEGGIYSDESFFLENIINPGNKVKGIVAWDVPKGKKPDRLELHDSLFSGGVTVNL
jgi:hypothetical protein